MQPKKNYNKKIDNSKKKCFTIKDRRKSVRNNYKKNYKFLIILFHFHTVVKFIHAHSLLVFNKNNTVQLGNSKIVLIFLKPRIQHEINHKNINVPITT